MTRPGKRITSRDIARAAGVSQTTVSFVLNNRAGQISEETRRRVLETAERLNYRVHATARSLAMGRSDIVLLAIPDVPMGAAITRFVEEFAAALAEHNLTLVTHLAGAHGRPLPDVCASVGASVVVGFASFDAETVEALRQVGVDVVPPADDDGASAMRPIGRIQAEYLINRGHRRIGYALPGHPGLLPMAEERLLGAAEACADAGIDPPVAVSTTLATADAARAVAQWTAQSVTGVCTFNDDTAAAVLAGLREHGLTAPSDIAVIGVDDTPTAHLTVPPLTTVSFELRDVARRRAESIVAALAGDEPFTRALLNARVHVVERSSA